MKNRLTKAQQNKNPVVNQVKKQEQNNFIDEKGGISVYNNKKTYKQSTNDGKYTKEITEYEVPGKDPYYSETGYAKYNYKFVDIKDLKGSKVRILKEEVTKTNMEEPLHYYNPLYTSHIKHRNNQIKTNLSYQAETDVASKSIITPQRSHRTIKRRLPMVQVAYINNALNNSISGRIIKRYPAVVHGGGCLRISSGPCRIYRPVRCYSSCNCFRRYTYVCPKHESYLVNFEKRRIGRLTQSSSYQSPLKKQ